MGRSKWNNTLLVRVHKEKQLRRLQELPFITRKVKVFASPDSVSQRKRTSFRKELSPWESNGEAYGSAVRRFRLWVASDCTTVGFVARA